MAGPLKRMLDDVTGTWSAMPKRQAFRWYTAALRHAPEVVKRRKLYPADREMRGSLNFRLWDRGIVINVDDISSTPGNAYAFLRELMVRQIYFRAFRPFRIRTAMDLGCNIGVVSTVLKELGGPDARVVGIDSQLFEGNAFRKKAENAPGITLEQAVLCGDEMRNNRDALAQMCAPFGYDPALATTLEEVMDRHVLAEVDFMKMDIEGAEYSLFAGKAAWLDRVRNLAMEVHRKAGNPAVIIKILEARGFAVLWSNDAGYACEMHDSGYIYASNAGNLRTS